MTNAERRLTRLEAHMDVDDHGMAWADVHHALQRQQARALLTLCQRLDVDPHDPRVVEALMWLVGDEPTRVRQDEEIIARWQRQQGITADTGGVRQRLTERLDEMARRATAQPSYGRLHSPGSEKKRPSVTDLDIAR
jgi:hypothetical protein